MPIYEYICTECGEEQEVLVRSETPRPVCRKCGSAGLTRRLSVFSVSSGGSESGHVCGCDGGGCQSAAAAPSGGCCQSGGCGCGG